MGEYFIKMQHTINQYNEVSKTCRNLFEKKLADYGAAWRVLRPSSVTDQIYIKVNRIRTLQMTDKKMIDEDEEEGFIAIVNYSVIALIQLDRGVSEVLDKEDKAEIMVLYDAFIQNLNTQKSDFRADLQQKLPELQAALKAKLARI